MNDEGQPVAYTALRKGTPVTSLSGHAFGTLDRVLDDGKGDILHGIAVATGQGLRFVARDSIERMTTARISCSLTDAQVRELPPAPSGRPARTWPRFARGA